MDSRQSSAELLRTQIRIWNQRFSYKNSACLNCAVQLGIPDVLHSHGKPMTLSQLTSALPINPSKAPYIYRLIRILVNAGFFAEHDLHLGNVQDEKGYLGEALGAEVQPIATSEKGYLGEAFEAEVQPFATSGKGYSLTSAGRLLLKDEPFSMRSMVQLGFDISTFKTWASLSDWFKNDDRTAFVTAHGKELWDYFAEDSRIQNLFNDSMARDSELIIKVLVEDCRFAFEGLTNLVDVGGGTGMVARAIVKAFPGLKCSVLELPQVIANQEGTETLEFVQGDMFQEIPKADAVMLKWVLHDWSDDDCIKILKNSKKAIPRKDDGGKLIIIDIVMGCLKASDDYETADVQSSMDMCMFLNFNAKERSEKEWAALFEAAGFSEYKVHALLGFRCLVEVYP